jgi:SAM-dependent methyltransferase
MFRNSAHVYDLIYAAMKDYAAEAQDVHALVQARRPGARSLLDVACGTGAHLRHLRQWYEVAGIDSDAQMLGQGRQQLPGVALVEADMRTFQLDRTFDAVICLFSSIGYMESTGELHDAVAAMVRHLAPGGVLVVDGWVRPDAWRDDSAPQLATGADDSLMVARIGLSRRTGDRTTLEMHHLIAADGTVDYVVDRHELTLFEPGDYTAAMRREGLQVEVTDGPMPGRDRYVGTRP